MKILVIGAHPADCFDLAGGTLFNHSNYPAILNFDEIMVVTMTDGLRTHIKENWQYINDTETIQREQKRCEFFDAAKVINAKTKCFGLRDGPFIFNESIINTITNLIREYKPDILITHHPNEYAHFDHAETGKTVCRALKCAIQNKSDDKYWTPMVYFFGVQFRPENARLGYIPQSIDILVELDDKAISKKIDMMCCFKSQGYDDVIMNDRINSFESEMGRADGLRYSEGFIFYYPLKRKLLLDNPENKQFYK